jgi:hypothetical protein
MNIIICIDKIEATTGSNYMYTKDIGTTSGSILSIHIIRSSCSASILSIHIIRSSRSASILSIHIIRSSCSLYLIYTYN